jgi:hypothetical protein
MTEFTGTAAHGLMRSTDAAKGDKDIGSRNPDSVGNTIDMPNISGTKETK